MDSASGIYALRDDLMLKHLNISLDFGRIKNSNKNPVAEKCVRKLGTEILHLNLAISNLNSRRRNRGLSSWEIIHQHDQLPFLDQALADTQAKLRENNQTQIQRWSACKGSKRKCWIPGFHQRRR